VGLSVTATVNVKRRQLSDLLADLASSQRELDAIPSVASRGGGPRRAASRKYRAWETANWSRLLKATQAALYDPSLRADAVTDYLVTLHAMAAGDPVSPSEARKRLREALREPVRTLRWGFRRDALARLVVAAEMV
jgi:hypothetical protein